MKRLFCYFVTISFLQMLFISQESGKALATTLGQEPTVIPQDVMPIVNPPNPQTNIVISLADFLTPGVSTYEAFNRAIDACRQQKAAKLVIPTGKYLFDDVRILSNGAHLNLWNLSDLTIDGQGSEFVFHYPIHGFSLLADNRILIRNLTIDYDLRIASVGRVQKESDGSHSIRVSDSYPVDEQTPVRSVHYFDTKNLKWKKNYIASYNPRNPTLIRPQTFVSPDFSFLTEGEEVIIRHYDYQGAVFVIPDYRCSDISFEDITIYSAPGMGFIVHTGNRGFRISRCRILRKPGAGRLISIAADGIHFTNTSGDILIEDCEISDQGDDPLNITGLWLTVTQKLNEKTLLLSRAAHGLIQPGSELKFCKLGDLGEYARARVSEVSYDFNTNLYTVTFGANIPDGIALGDFVANVSQNNSRFVVRRNFFHDFRGRGMLIQSPNGLIEENRVKDPTDSGMHITTDNFVFKEAYGCENLIVRNNTFEGCSYGGEATTSSGRHMASINILADVPSGLSEYPVHRNILFENNTIADTPGLAILVASSNGVTVRNNTIVRSNQIPFDSYHTGEAFDAKAKGSIMVTRASNVSVTGNHQVISSDMFDKGVYVDQRNTSNIVVQDNIEERSKPNIETVGFDGKKTLTIKGNNFDRSSRVLINGNDRTSFLGNVSATEIILKGKAKKLKLKSGDNTIQVIDSSGVASNIFLLKL